MPRLFVIPSELSPFRDLFLSMGVPQSFSSEQYSLFLGDMVNANHGSSLSANELDQALAVVQVRISSVPPSTLR